MKFINNKTIRERANELYSLRVKRAALVAQLKDIKTEIESLEQFVYDKAKGQNFQFNGDEGYLMELEFKDRSNQILDEDLVRAHFEDIQEQPPVKTEEWIEVKVRYAQA